MERTLGDATHMAPALPVRKTDHLHRHRVSLPGCRYFLTFCALRPVDVLTHPALGQRLLAQIRELFTGQDATFLCATLMPDHAHVLFRLGDRLTLGQLAGKFKAKTAAALEQHGAIWQRDFYDRRLHSEDMSGDFARYIFLNPYRRELISRRTVWSWWQRGAEVYDFESMLEDGLFPPAEWLATP